MCHVLPLHLRKDIKVWLHMVRSARSSSHFIQLFPRRSRRARNTRHPSPPMRQMTLTRIAVTGFGQTVDHLQSHILRSILQNPNHRIANGCIELCEIVQTSQIGVAKSTQDGFWISREIEMTTLHLVWKSDEITVIH